MRCYACLREVERGSGHAPDCIARRECEACGGPVSNLRQSANGLVGDCPEHGTTPAWITGALQNGLDQMRTEEQAARVVAS
jgi:hypothetical protein